MFQSRGGAEDGFVIHGAAAEHYRVVLAVGTLGHVFHVQQREALGGFAEVVDGVASRGGDPADEPRDVGAAEVMIAEPANDRVGQQDAGLRFRMRGMLHRKIGGRIDQHLSRDRRAVIAR